MSQNKYIEYLIYIIENTKLIKDVMNNDPECPHIKKKEKNKVIKNNKKL